MRETKDPAIKLFGKTIPLADPPVSSSPSVFGGVLSPPPDPAHEDLTSSPEENQSDQEPDEVLSAESLSDAKQENGTRPITCEEIADSNATEVAIENLETQSVENEAATTKSLKTEEEGSDTSNSQEKTLKKPDEILPCPRCNSMDTKFCYYNNYNVNQPRYFCKNCQRYWTAGGTMRNVPVGAGRRKNKNLASHYHHITMSEALENVKPNGTVLTFGTDSPLCESTAQVLDIAESTMRNCAPNGFHKQEEKTIPVSYGGGQNGDQQSSGPCFPGAPWPYTWNSPQWRPAFWTPGYLMPFYPAPSPYWGCTMPGSLNVPWVTSPSYGPNSPTLGKRSREEIMVKQTSSDEEETEKENNPERYLWIPKTLRIDDLGEAERSSILAILGIKNDKADSVSEGGGLFKAFQSKGGDKNHISDTSSSVLHANLAAV